MLATLPYQSRVEAGRRREPEITDRLARHGFKMTSATVSQDMHDKIDAHMDGKPIQYKFRESGDDILLDFFEPFHGFDSTFNVPAKDLVTKAEWFAILHRSDRLVLVSRMHMHCLFAVVYAEWQHHVTDKISRALTRSFRSKKHPAVELKVTRDHANGRCKLLMFVDSKQIKHIEVKS